MKFIIIFLIILSAAVLVGYFFIYHFLPYSPIKPIRIKSELMNKFNDKEMLIKDLNPKKMQFLTKDSLILKAYYIQTEQTQKKGTIILLHGISDCKESLLNIAIFFNKIGYNTLLPDMRAHGESEGKYCTFGYYEKFDIKVMIDSLIKLDTIKNIGIWGNSLGGAIAIQAMGIDKRIKFGIIESTFDKLKNVILEYSADMFLGLKINWLVEIILEESNRIANFDYSSVLPVESSRNITQPILFFHGDKDDKIPIEFNRKNFNAVKSSIKKFIVIKGAGHFNLWNVGGVLVENEIKQFLEKIAVK